MEKKVKVYAFFVSGNKRVMEITDDLETFQGMVGGYIDYIRFGKGIDMVINDEGKLYGLPINRLLAYGGEVYDVICGDVFFVGHDDEGGSASLTDEQINYIKWKIANNRYMFNKEA